MSGTIDSNGVTLTGDGFGVNWVRKQLSAAPSAAVKMQFVARLYFLDNVTSANNYTAKGWDSCAFFGLGFTDEIYDFSAADTIAPTDFLGNITTTNIATSGPVYEPDYKSYSCPYLTSQAFYVPSPMAATGGGRIQYMARMDGIGNKLSETLQQSTGSTPNGTQMGMCFPVNATHGAKITLMFEVWGSAIDKTVYMRQCHDFASLAEGDTMFTAMDAKSVGTGLTSILENTIHGDVTSNWRNEDDTMNFPRWLKFKYPLPEYSLRLKYYKVRFLDATDTVIS